MITIVFTSQTVFCRLWLEVVSWIEQMGCKILSMLEKYTFTDAVLCQTHSIPRYVQMTQMQDGFVGVLFYLIFFLTETDQKQWLNVSRSWLELLTYIVQFKM